jgi:tetratricopeptide (TPR) repeat protein
MEHMSNARLPRMKRNIFTLMMIATPILVLLLLELGLRLFGYGGNLDLFILDKSPAKPEYVLNKNFTRRYFFQKGIRTPVPISQRFSAKKDGSTYRIFCLGESTTQGFPYPPNGAFPAQLKNILSILNPNRNIEVVNCGITAITSHSVLDIEREILKKYKPDLLVIYTGHNEFYGVFGQASRLALFKSRAFTQAFLRMQRCKLFLLARDIVARLFSKPINRDTVNGSTTLMGIISNQAGIPYEGEVFRRTEEQFRANLEDMVLEAQKHRVGLIVCTLAANLADQPPFSMLQGMEDFQTTQNPALSDLLMKADQCREGGHYRNAVSWYLQALQQDSIDAGIHYRLGQSYAALNQFGDAGRHYRLANDYDAIRFRAPSSFNRMIRELTRKYRVPLADVEEAFSEASPIGIPGSESILEHVHPNIRGYLMMAKCIAGKIPQNKILSGSRALSPALPDSLYLAMTHLTPLDYEAAHFTIFSLTSQWPFATPDGNRVYRRAGTERTERMVRRMIEEGKGSLVQLHLDLGKELISGNQEEEGLKEYKAALAIEPLGEIYNRIASVYARRAEMSYRILKDYAGALQNYKYAVSYFRDGLEQCPKNLELNLDLGLLLMMRNDRLEDAYALFEKVLLIDPLQKNAKRMMIRLLLRKNDFWTANEKLLRFVKIHPDDAEFCTDLGYVNFRLQNYPEAENWLKKALALSPKQQRAIRLLDEVRAKLNRP